MKKIVTILCEGVTDIAFIFILLQKWLNCEFIDNSKRKDEDLFSLNVSHFEEYAWYKNEKYYFIVCSTNGACSMFDFFNKHLKDKIEENIISSVIFIRDRDCESDEDIINSSKETIIDCQINEWVNTKITNWSEDYYDVNSYLCVIPHEREGALEDVLLNSMGEDQDIADLSCEFVDKLPLNYKRHINKSRYISKAKLGVSFSLIKPDATFSSFSSKIKDISIDSDAVIENFSFLKQFK